MAFVTRNPLIPAPRYPQRARVHFRRLHGSISNRQKYPEPEYGHLSVGFLTSTLGTKRHDTRRMMDDLDRSLNLVAVLSARAGVPRSSNQAGLQQLVRTEQCGCVRVLPESEARTESDDARS